MKNIFFILLLFISTFSFGQARNNNPNVYNVKLFGARGDGVTNDTRAIQSAINAADSSRGGKVFFPNGIYVVSDTIRTSCNCQIYIPTRSYADTLRSQIELVGEEKPSFNPVGGGISGPALGPMIKSGSIIKSTLATGGAARSAVFAANATSLSHAYLNVENLIIQVKNNPSGTGPIIGGVSMRYGSSLTTMSSIATVDTSGQVTTYPNNDVTGWEFPDNGSEEMNVSVNTLSIGFRKGFSFSEHTTLNNAYAWCCYYGQFFKGGSNSIRSVTSGAYWCPYTIYVSGTVATTFANYNIESAYQVASKWYDAIFTVKDSSNLGQGQIFYTFDGGLNANFTKSGGANIFTMPNADGVTNGYVGRVVVPTVASGVIQSSLVVGGAINSATLTLQATSHAAPNTGADIIFKTNLTERMRILNDGTTTVTSNSANAFNLVGASGAGSRVSYTAQNTTASGNTSFYFQNDRGSFASYGGVLHGGSTYTGSILGLTNSDQTVLLSDGSSLGLLIAEKANAPVIIGTNNLERMRIIGSGLVGINRTPITDQLEVAGNISLTTAGNKLKITTGTNASIGVSAAMTAGTITISTTAVTASSKIFLVHATLGGVQGILSVGTITGGTSFVINSSSAADTGTVNWWVVN